MIDYDRVYKNFLNCWMVDGREAFEEKYGPVLQSMIRAMLKALIDELDYKLKELRDEFIKRK